MLNTLQPSLAKSFRGKISKEEYFAKRDKLSADIEKVVAEISNLQTSYGL